MEKSFFLTCSQLRGINLETTDNKITTDNRKRRQRHFPKQPPIFVQSKCTPFRPKRFHLLYQPRNADKPIPLCNMINLLSKHSILTMTHTVTLSYICSTVSTTSKPMLYWHPPQSYPFHPHYPA